MVGFNGLLLAALALSSLPTLLAQKVPANLLSKSCSITHTTRNSLSVTIITLDGFCEGQTPNANLYPGFSAFASNRLVKRDVAIQCSDCPGGVTPDQDDVSAFINDLDGSSSAFSIPAGSIDCSDHNTAQSCIINNNPNGPLQMTEGIQGYYVNAISNICLSQGLCGIAADTNNCAYITLEGAAQNLPPYEETCNDTSPPPYPNRDELKRDELKRDE